MNCEILQTLYIRSNGEVPCNDDTGESVHLGDVRIPDGAEGATIFSPDQLFENAKYRHIRAELAAGRAPWADTCRSCAFFRPLEPFSDELRRRHIRKIQFEPSLACNLRCPGCSNGIQFATRTGPSMMSVSDFGAVVGSIAAEGYRVDEVEYCGQGEPLLHPRFPLFVDAARGALPEARQRVITNGNVDYAKALDGRALDEVFVSCDGVHQSSYEKYRVRGSVSRAHQFMRDVPAEKNGIRQTLVWKYILFEFNDSDEEIEQAQYLAQDLGVDTLMFVFTHSESHSIRWTAERAGEFPILLPNVTTSATPIHSQHGRTGKPLGEWPVRRRFRRDRVRANLDSVSILDDRLVARGWAVADYHIDRIDMEVDGHGLGPVRHGLPRPDVMRAFPALATSTSGFALSTTLPVALADRIAGTHRVGMRIHGARQEHTIELDYDFS